MPTLQDILINFTAQRQKEAAAAAQRPPAQMMQPNIQQIIQQLLQGGQNGARGASVGASTTGGPATGGWLSHLFTGANPDPLTTQQGYYANFFDSLSALDPTGLSGLISLIGNASTPTRQIASLGNVNKGYVGSGSGFAAGGDNRTGGGQRGNQRGGYRGGPVTNNAGQSRRAPGPQGNVR